MNRFGHFDLREPGGSPYQLASDWLALQTRIKKCSDGIPHGRNSLLSSHPPGVDSNLGEPYKIRRCDVFGALKIQRKSLAAQLGPQLLLIRAPAFTARVDNQYRCICQSE